MNHARRLVALCLTLLTAACSQASLVAVNLPTHFDDIVVDRNVGFGPDDWQKLDIYHPPGDGRSTHDVIIFYYGGRWETGSKDDYKFVGSTLAREGFVVVIPDYRKYPTVGFPGFVQDAAQSLAWTSDHIQRFGGDPARIHVAGHSAGAHIGMLLTVDPSYLRAERKDRSAVIHDFAGLAGPYDFVPTDKDLVQMFGPPSRYPLMQASTFINGKQPPILMLWGDRDQFVGKINMDKVMDAVHKKGGCAASKTYAGVDHIWIVAGLSWLGKNKAPVRQDMTEFFRGRHECR